MLDKDIKAFSERLKLALPKHYSVTSFAKEINISVSGFRKWLNAQAEPSRDNLIAIAEKAGVSLEWLATGQGDMFLKNEFLEDTGNSIPVVGFASCGLSMGWQNEKPLDYKIIAPNSLKDKSAFAFLSKGTSMQPEGIVDGSTCIVSPSMLPISGRPVYIRSKIWHNNKKITVSSIKRFEYIKDNKVFLSGWLEPDSEGKQEKFEEERSLDLVDLMAPVVCVFAPECPPVVVEDKEIPFSAELDIDMLEKCLFVIDNQKALSDLKKKSKITALLYQKAVKDRTIDKNYLSELIFLAK